MYTINGLYNYGKSVIFGDKTFVFINKAIERVFFFFFHTHKPNHLGNKIMWKLYGSTTETDINWDGIT